MPVVKQDPRKPAKAEPCAGVKAERLATIKREGGGGGGAAGVLATLKREVKKEEMMKQEELRIKREAKREVKAEGSGSSFESMLARGMALRQQAKNAKSEFKGARVKLEKGKKGRASRKSGKRGAAKKRRGSAARRNASREVISRPVQLSQQLADLLGAPALSRPEAVSRFWAHCRDQGMLNPEDKREIVFNDQLARLLGQPTAKMTGLMGLLMPHFDYACEAAKVETGAAAHTIKQQAVKAPCKDECVPVKRPCKGEQLNPPRKAEPELCKGEPKPKSEQFGAQAFCRAPDAVLKREPAVAVATEADLAELARQIVPRLTKIGRDTVTVSCQPPAGAHSFDVIAAPNLPARTGSASAGPASVRRSCAVDFRETEDGSLEAHAEACLAGLDPDVSYSISIEVLNLSAGTRDDAPRAAGRSPEVALAQRASPERWTPQEAYQWCVSLQIPELARKAREYAIDGTTLISLGDEDLAALGLAAPFLRRRVLAGLASLRPLPAASGGG